jgi:hypothetical protein
MLARLFARADASARVLAAAAALADGHRDGTTPDPAQQQLLIADLAAAVEAHRQARP